MKLEAVYAELRIDMPKLVAVMATRALRNRTGKTATLEGAIRIKRLK